MLSTCKIVAVSAVLAMTAAGLALAACSTMNFSLEV
jgi:hypothetical protein